MTYTAWRDDYTRRVPRRAVGWTPDDAGAWHQDMPFANVVGPGGLLTTVGDLLRGQESFSSGPLGGARLANDMRRPGVLRDGRVTGYALGLEIGREYGVNVVSHGGSTAGKRAYLGEVAGFEVRTTRMRAIGFERVAAASRAPQPRSSP